MQSLLILDKLIAQNNRRISRPFRPFGVEWYAINEARKAAKRRKKKRSRRKVGRWQEVNMRVKKARS